MPIPGILINDYDYDLPEGRIAVHPLPLRDQSKLLVYDQGKISDLEFPNLDNHLSGGDMLILNDTRVIHARMYFRKETGGIIEIFCLNPSHTSHVQALSATMTSTWICLVGGARKWKAGEILMMPLHVGESDLILQASLEGRIGEHFQVKFTWESTSTTFSELLASAGELPLPPYFNRKAETEDYDRYQTAMAMHEGSVAAPTAGLHFTAGHLSRLESRGVLTRRITLHVGAGTFRPVSVQQVADHPMHPETFSVSRDFIKELSEGKHSRLIPVGTTSLRAIESLYWLGVKNLLGTLDKKNIGLKQWEAYELPSHFTNEDAMMSLVELLKSNQMEALVASTSILIAPGYRFRFIDGLVTNFHMPKSTLLVLIAALIGDEWKRVYQHALESGYRFLSYGDSSLLLR